MFQRALFVLLCLAGVARAQTTLSIPIPERESLPREKISLTIKLPEKVERIEEPPPVRPKVRSSVFDHYRFDIREEVPRADFVYATLDRLEALGIRPDLASRQLRRMRQREYTVWGRAIWTYYEKLMDIYRQDALAHFDLTPLDLERFRQVMDIFSRLFEAEWRPVLEADRNLTRMIELLKKIRGQGTIKVVELQEAADGSMTLEVQVRKEPLLTSRGRTPRRYRARWSN